jgi:hypothetical protein
VKLLIDILQGLGLAQAAGIRPFLPALVAAGAGKGNVLVDFSGTDFAFLESTWWLLAMAVLAILALLLRGPIERSAPLSAALQGIALGMGGVLFAGVLADDGYTWWPGLIAGVAAAWLSATASRDLFARAGRRLDEDARSHIAVWADGVAILLAALSIIAPPVALVALGFFVWLLLGRRRREGEKYAGLRVLR